MFEISQGLNRDGNGLYLLTEEKARLGRWKRLIAMCAGVLAFGCNVYLYYSLCESDLKF